MSEDADIIYAIARLQEIIDGDKASKLLVCEAEMIQRLLRELLKVTK